MSIDSITDSILESQAQLDYCLFLLSPSAMQHPVILEELGNVNEQQRIRPSAKPLTISLIQIDSPQYPAFDTLPASIQSCFRQNSYREWSSDADTVDLIRELLYTLTDADPAEG